MTPLAPREGSACRIGYVVKRYPRYSETFIVNEILAHEAAGVEVDIFSLRPCTDTHFQDSIALVRAGVTQVPYAGVNAALLWSAVEDAVTELGLDGAALRHARGAIARDAFQALVIAVHARRRGVDLLHAHFGTSATEVARLASFFCGIPYTFTAHAKDIFHEEVDPRDLGRKIADAAAVVTVSEFNLAHLRSAYGHLETPIERIYNGLDLERFRWVSPRDRPPTIVGVGRLVEKKGFRDLVAACAILRDQGVDFRCGIIGEGPLERELREQIIDHRLDGQVTLVGPRPQAEMARLVQGAAAFVAPCVVGDDGNRDGLPTVLLEAMALGTPCVATDVTGIPEIVRDGETGCLISQHDPEGLAMAVRGLLQDPVRRVRLASAARQLVERELDCRITSERLRDIFNRAVCKGLPTLVGAGT